MTCLLLAPAEADRALPLGLGFGRGLFDAEAAEEAALGARLLGLGFGRGFRLADRLLAEGVFKFYLCRAGLYLLFPQTAVRALEEVVLFVIGLGQLAQLVHEAHGVPSNECCYFPE